MAARRRLRGTSGCRRASASNETDNTEDSPPAKKTRRCQRQEVKKKPVPGGKADEDRTEDKQECVKTLLLKGKAPVDPECTLKVGKAHIYCEGNDVYDVMLNQIP
uniref:Poly(ADP-ribose) polymerase 2 n=1 Tax=Pipistrellus kuhlii TaxID=59472 RepID=A0A7J8B373_PIPKU|nr:poly(ADP-ribose) polymerase 2 [Pipistrellus kuhlii]